MKGFVFLLFSGFVLSSTAMAQSYGSYGQYTGYSSGYTTYPNLSPYPASCGYADPSGDVHVVVSKDCTIKNKVKVTKDAQEVTFQQTYPFPGIPGNSKTVTATLIATQRDGKLSTYTVAQGESLGKAQSYIKTVYDRDMNVKQLIMMERDEKKRPQEYVTYDAHLCKRLSPYVNSQEKMTIVNACATTLNEVMVEMNGVKKDLAHDKLKLGYFDGAKLQEVSPQNMLGPLTILSSCAATAQMARMSDRGSHHSRIIEGDSEDSHAVPDYDGPVDHGPDHDYEHNDEGHDATLKSDKGS